MKNLFIAILMIFSMGAHASLNCQGLEQRAKDSLVLIDKAYDSFIALNVVSLSLNLQYVLVISERIVASKTLYEVLSEDCAQSEEERRRFLSQINELEDSHRENEYMINILVSNM